MNVLTTRLHPLKCRLVLYFALAGLVPAALAATQAKPLDKRQIVGLVRGDVASVRVAKLVRNRGIDFHVSKGFLKQLQTAGAKPVLLDELQAASLPAPERRSPPKAQARPEPKPVSTGLSAGAKAFADKRLAAKQHCVQGERLLDAGLWTKAVTELQQSVDLNPSDPAAHFYLGRALSGERRWDAAIVEYRLALHLAPDSAPTHYNLASALLARGNFAAAARQYRATLGLLPDDEKALYGLGAALYGLKDYAAAEARFHQALQLDPVDQDALCAMGLTLLRRGDARGSAREYRKALHLDPHNATAHAGLGYALLKEGEKLQALNEFKIAASIQPNNGNYRASYGAVWRQLNP